MRWLVLVHGVVAYLLGVRSLIYFVGFASNIPWVKTVNSGQLDGWPKALAVNLSLLLLFALSHSLMARSAFKRAYVRWLPEATLRSSYTLVAALVLSLLMWQWKPIETVVWDASLTSGRFLLLGVAAAGWILAATAYYSIGHLHLLGLRQAYRAFRGRHQVPGDLVTNGVYRYLRDPMYLGFTIGMWATPLMTVGHLLLSVGMTFYLLIGMRYERRDLIVRFGNRYLESLRGRHRGHRRA